MKLVYLVYIDDGDCAPCNMQATTDISKIQGIVKSMKVGNYIFCEKEPEIIETLFTTVKNPDPGIYRLSDSLTLHIVRLE